jgi:hypothetical protein
LEKQVGTTLLALEDGLSIGVTGRISYLGLSRPLDLIAWRLADLLHLIGEERNHSCALQAV